MQDKTVSAGCVLACGLWATTAIIILVASVQSSLVLANIGCALSAAAATATIRQYFVTTNQVLRNAFRAARDLEEAIPLRRR